jgi:hypothetical protein
MTSGSAEQYIPGDPRAPYLYAVKVSRRPPPDKHDKFWVRCLNRHEIPRVKNHCQVITMVLHWINLFALGTGLS